VQERREFIRLGVGGLLGLFASCRLETTPEHIPLEDRLPTYDLSSASWEEIQKEFHFNETNFFNNGTIGPSPLVVQKVIQERIAHVNSTTSYTGFERIALKHLASLINADEGEVAITQNVTNGINIAAWAFDLKPGDEVIISDQEHVGNAIPWLNRQQQDGIKLVVMSIPPTAEECLKMVESKITKNTKIIALPHITCTTGQVLPIKKICELASRNNIRTCIDGAHGLGCLNLDIKDLDCDVYATCAHKWLLGPKGVGALFVKKSLIQEMKVMFAGGHTDLGWEIGTENVQFDGFKSDAHRFFYGTQNSALHAGLAAACMFMESIGKQRVENRIRELNQYTFNKLKTLKGFKIVSPEEEASRAGMVSVKLDSIQQTKTLYSKLSLNSWVVRYVGESDLHAMRISTHIYNSQDQIDLLIHQLTST
jgi:L-cysteine/cystine lyase